MTKRVIFLSVIAATSMALWAQSTKEPPTMREVLAANGITETREYPDHFLNGKITWAANLRYAHSSYHINPSAERLFIVSRDLKIAGDLEGWELLTLPDERVVYHHNEIHFAPTHSGEIWVFNPVTGQKRKIYPPKPNQPVRQAFVRRVAEVYKQRGEAWFRDHNHHMDPEKFDSALIGSVIFERSSNSISFTVRYGDPENSNDQLPFTQQIAVRCAPVRPEEQLICREEAR